MLAVIMAGGRGTRLEPLTMSMPKSMAPIGQKPFLLYKINNYIRQGINRFIICTGYMSEKIEEYFKDGRDFGCQIVYSKEKEPLGTGGALKHAEHLLEDEFLLVNGDNLNVIDIKEFINFFRNSGQIGAMAVCYNLTNDKYQSNVTYDKLSRMIIEYKFSGNDGMKFIDTGERCLKKDILSYFPDRIHFSIEEEVFTMLAMQKKLAGYEIEKQPIDIGTPENLKSAKQILVDGKYE